MSDLSLPPLETLQADAGLAVSGPPAKTDTVGEPCEIEGLNGRRVRGRLQGFDPQARQLQFRVGTARTLLPVAFGQFRRLCLTRPYPVYPSQASAEDGSAAPRLQQPLLPFRVQYGDGSVWEGHTLGHRRRPCGWFLFEPTDDARAVRRSFVPASAVRQVELGHGDEGATHAHAVQRGESKGAHEPRV